MGRLDGRVAIVTGGARGLGAAAAAALCAEGAAVMITDVLDAEGRQHADALARGGHRVDFLHHDVREANEWSSVVAATIERFGEVNILVNNAGINLPITIEDASAEQFRSLLDVNLIGPFLGMKAVAPSMRRAGRGSIINLASNSTQMVLPLTSLYGATKAALANLSKSSAVHFARGGDDIRVNSVHPGAHATAMMSDPAVLAMPQVKSLVQAIPMGRMGHPSELGTVIAFLASDDSSYITASEIFADGGLTVVSYGEN